jgi:hypothetical protein
MSSKQIITIAVVWVVIGGFIVVQLIRIGNTNPDAQAVYLVSAAILFVILVVVPILVLSVRYLRNRRALQASGDPDGLGSTRFALTITQFEEPLEAYCAATQVAYRRPRRSIFTANRDALVLFAVENPAEPLVRIPWKTIERIASPKPAGIHGPTRRVLVVTIREGSAEFRLPLVLSTVVGTTFISDAVVNDLLSKLGNHLVAAA